MMTARMTEIRTRLAELKKIAEVTGEEQATLYGELSVLRRQMDMEMNALAEGIIAWEAKESPFVHPAEKKAAKEALEAEKLAAKEALKAEKAEKKAAKEALRAEKAEKKAAKEALGAEKAEKKAAKEALKGVGEWTSSEDEDLSEWNEDNDEWTSDEKVDETLVAKEERTGLPPRSMRV